MQNPFDLLKEWISDERKSGAPNPQQAVLSTTTKDGIPHARVVAIREITLESLLFFTQKETRKEIELLANPNACITFWFELLQREVIIEGIAEPLSLQENNQYWETYPREAQIRFCSYAPTSSKPIKNKQLLETIRKQLEFDFRDKEIPMNPYYCGFRFKPHRIIFYAYLTSELSDVFEYRSIDNNWVNQILSP